MGLFGRRRRPGSGKFAELRLGKEARATVRAFSQQCGNYSVAVREIDEFYFLMASRHEECLERHIKSLHPSDYLILAVIRSLQRSEPEVNTHTSVCLTLMMRSTIIR
jgi:hypothetical protein